MSFLIMSIYEKPKLTANITLHGERLEISLQRHEHNKDVCSLHLYSALEVPAPASRQENESKAPRLNNRI